MNTISVEQLQTWLTEGRPVTVLDVRPMEQRVEWAIPGSIHLDVYHALNKHDVHALDAVQVTDDVPIVTVCAAGKTSQLAAEQLAKRGINAFSLKGGMKAWSLAWNTAEVSLDDSSAQVIQIRRTGKGCLSYLLGAGKEAFVIDASLDPHIYLDLASSHGWQITSVFDTHLHADHLSRSRLLAEQSGAMLFLPNQKRVSFPFTAIRDGNTLASPSLMLTALQTPGHTPESTCYLLNNQVLLTGDTLFPTGVGRPDLHANEEQAQKRAEALYHSLHKLLALPSETLVLAGHTSSPVPFDAIPIVMRLGEIDEQVSLLHTSRTTFVQMTLTRIPPTPPNYQRIVMYNERGLLPESDVTELEAGANRCAIS